MIGCFWTRVRKQPIIPLYFESANQLKFYNLEARTGMLASDKMRTGSGWYGFIGAISPSTTDISLYGKVTKAQENITNKRAKRLALSQQVITRLQGTDKTA